MAKKENFSFLSNDKQTKIHGIKWIPEDGKYIGIVQLIHGMVEFIDRYDEFATYLTEHGFLVVGHDHLGHGESVLSENLLGYMAPEPSDTLIRDIQAVREMFEEKGKPYFMLGHSMGSYMLRKYLALHGEGLSGAIIMGTGYVPETTVKFGMQVAKLQAKLFGWKHRSKLLQQMSYSKPYRKFSLDGSDVNNSWLTKDPLMVEKYYANPKCTFIFTDNAYMGLFEAVLFSCNQEHVNEIPKELPVFFVSGKDDPVGDLGVGVKKVYDMFQEAGMSDITWKLYEDDRHEILNEMDRADVYHDIWSWIQVRVG